MQNVEFSTTYGLISIDLLKSKVKQCTQLVKSLLLMII